MDRNRERDGRRPRDFDFPPEDQYGTGRGQSYRPGGARERSPQPPAMRNNDTYRARSPPLARRDGYGDSYRARSRTPPLRGANEYRRRSPTPPRFREREREPVIRGGDSYRGVRPARSPVPQRRDDLLPRDDLFRRGGGRDYRDDRDYGGRRDDRDRERDRDRGYEPAAPTRSPPQRYRERSPLPVKRGRDVSPVGSRGRRTPPPAKRERVASPLPPRSRYDDNPATSRAPSPPRQQSQYQPGPSRGRYSPEALHDRRPSPPRSAARDYRPRSRSPLARSARIDPRDVDDWRSRRSVTPPRGAYERRDESGRNSVATSRRSSPHVHPSRLVANAINDQTPREVSGRSPLEPPRRISPAHGPDSEREREKVVAEERNRPQREPYRTEDAAVPSRAPPSGPAGYRAPATSMAPPTGPAAAAVSVSAHTRAPAAPPSGPRATASMPFAPRGRGGFAGDFRGGRGGFGGGAPYRGGRGGSGFPQGGGFGRGGDSFARNDSQYQEPNAGPPSGPRGSFSSTTSTPTVPYRPSSNSTATTYPRTQRFGLNGQPIPDASSPSQASLPTNNNVNASSTTAPTGPRAFRRPTEPAADRPLRNNSIAASNATLPAVHPSISSLPQILPGGAKAAPLVDSSRLAKLQEEAEKLRKQIEEKEAKKRKSLREWERMSREVEVAGLRSELAGQAVRKLEMSEDLGDLGMSMGSMGHSEAAF